MEFLAQRYAEEFALRKIQREPIRLGDRAGLFYKK